MVGGHRHCGLMLAAQRRAEKKGIDLSEREKETKKRMRLDIWAFLCALLLYPWVIVLAEDQRDKGSFHSTTHVIHSSVQDYLSHAQKKIKKNKNNDPAIIQARKEAQLEKQREEASKYKRRTYAEQKKAAKESRAKHREAWARHKNRYSRKKPQKKETVKEVEKQETDGYEYDYDYEDEL